LRPRVTCAGLPASGNNITPRLSPQPDNSVFISNSSWQAQIGNVDKQGSEDSLQEELKW
jgi:hypothetical protein